MSAAEPLPQPAQTQQPVASFFVRGTPVSANAMYRSRAAAIRAQGQALYMTPEAAEWRTCVAYEAMSYRIQARSWRLPLSIVVAISQRKGDVDNYLKLTLDGLKVGLMIDDRHYTSVQALRDMRALLPSGVTITIYEADPPA